MPVYNPNEYVWREFYLMFDRVESFFHLAAHVMYWVSLVLVVAGIGGLLVLLLFSLGRGRRTANRPAFHMVLRAIVSLLMVTMFSGAHQGEYDNTPAIAQTTEHVWFVRPGADGDGTSMASPIGSAEALEAVSGPGDLILLHPAEEPLDGGLVLKTGQTLIGVSVDGLKPAITNIDAKRHAGNGIVLAEGARIWNVRIEDTHASGIFGMDVAGVSIDGVEIVGANKSASFTTSEMKPLGSLPHGGIVLIQSDSSSAGANRIVRSEIIGSAGLGIASITTAAARSELVVSDSRVEGGTPVARFDMGIVAGARGASARMHLELTGTTVYGRMSRGGRNVVIVANSDATATARIERSHLAEVGQDGILGVALQVPAAVKLEIRDTIIEKAGQTNLEGTILNLPPFDASRVAETLMSIHVEDSIIRDAGTATHFEQDDIGAGNIWIGSSAMAQQMSPGSKAPFLPGRFRLGVRNSYVEGSADFAIGVGNEGSRWGIAPEAGTFEVELHDNTIAVDGTAEVLIAAPGVIVDARRNCWGASGGLSEERIRVLETADRTQLDASEPLSCNEN